ncbi:hypothetical protein Dsin_021067 [Dipteronia sinensis]|uniref:F-box domain-containing protein n=1 Tax=Dipteronia sinensis TaxID=43782 RepID=A0AAE0AAI5_9ROSI|nr:hypothetical protein Dsin_021067 [Dipteronia sinensis]
MEEVGVQISQMLCDESTKDNGDVLVAVVGLFLPYEIFFEILSWLPVKYLVRCKCVCKKCYKMIEERSFIMKHLRCSNLVKFYCEDEVENLDVDGIIVQETFKNEQVFAGLSLEKGDISCKYRLRNFTTQEILYLPNPHEDTFRIYIFPLSGGIKLMSFYGDKNSRHVNGLEILNLDKNDKWRPLKFPILQRGQRRFFNNTLPQGLFSNLSEVLIFIWNGCLAFGDLVEEKLNLIVLEDYRMHKWSKTKIVVPLTFLKENPDLKKQVPICLCKDKVWFYSNQGH